MLRMDIMCENNTEPTYAPLLHPQPCMVSTNSHVYETDLQQESQKFKRYPAGTGKCSVNIEEQKVKINRKYFKKQYSAESLAETLMRKKYSNVEVYQTKKSKYWVTKWDTKTGLNLLQHLGLEETPITEMTLVSHGEPNQNCGDLRAKLYCQDTGSHIKNLTHICHRAECPICWSHWVERETTRATEKFLAGVQLLKETKQRHAAYHIVFSPPKEEHNLTLKQLRTRLNYRMKWAGVEAAAVIFHPFRFRNVITKEAVDWKHCSLNRNAESPVIESEAYYSPHFHVAGVGFLKPSNKFFEQFGWTYKKMGWKKLDDEDSVRSMIYYALSHCGVADGKHALTWNLKFGNRHMLIKDIETEIKYPNCSREKCACKNKSLIIIEYQKDIGEYIDQGTRELYWIQLVKTTYTFNQEESLRYRNQTKDGG